MRFGLSDLEELPSLKEFEQLAQAALGSDEGIAPTEPELQPNSELAAPSDAAPVIGEGNSSAEVLASTGETNDLAGSLAMTQPKPAMPLTPPPCRRRGNPILRS